MRLGRTISWKCHLHESESFHHFSKVLEKERENQRSVSPRLSALAVSPRVSALAISQRSRLSVGRSRSVPNIAVRKFLRRGSSVPNIIPRRGI